MCRSRLATQRRVVLQPGDGTRSVPTTCNSPDTPSPRDPALAPHDRIALAQDFSSQTTIMPTFHDQIAAHEAVPSEQLTLREQAQRFAQVCRDAASLEASRRKSGLPEPTPAPWPESTWAFLAEQTRRARSRG
jgi:hypothetical protein